MKKECTCKYFSQAPYGIPDYEKDQWVIFIVDKKCPIHGYQTEEERKSEAEEIEEMEKYFREHAF